MSDTKTLRQGDTPKTIYCQAFTADNPEPDLTLFPTITFYMVGQKTGTVVQGTGIGTAQGGLSYQFTGTQLDIPDTYEATFRGTGASEPQTFPEGTNLHIIVEPAL